MPKVGEGTLEVDRERVVDRSADAPLVERAQHGVAPGHTHDVQMPDVSVADAYCRTAHVLDVIEQLVVASCRIAALAVPLREMPKLCSQHHGLQRVEPGVEPGLRVLVLR